MKDNDTIKLSELFQQKVENYKLDYSSVALMLITQDKIDAIYKKLTPIKTAEYLKFFLETQNDLFKRLELKNGIIAPLTLFINGEYRHEELDRIYALEPAFAIQFMNDNDRSRITINYDTIYSPTEERRKEFSGPEIRDFISALEKAGQDWKNLEFEQTGFTPPTATRKPHLRIVKS